MDLFDLTGRVAIVTGGNRGIGYAIAEGLARHGAHVVIANRDATSGQEAALRLQDQGFVADAVPTDVSDGRLVARLVEDVLDRHGGIDILVNNAAVIVRKPVEDVTEEEYDRVMSTNLRGAFLCSRDVGRHMIEKRRGKIVNVSSNVSQVVQPLRSIYSVSKAGLSHMTRAMALEWAPYGVNVNAIGPGPTLTDINRQYFKDHPEDLQARVDQIPMGRIGMPADQVGVAVFLASAASDYMTGQTVLVDGGTNLP